MTLATVILRDLFANRPAAGIAGRLFFASDTGAIYWDSGSAWSNVTPPSGSTILTVKGDLLTFDTAPVRIPVGIDELPLYTDSNQSKGIKWGFDNLLTMVNNPSTAPWSATQMNIYTAVADSQGGFRASKLNPNNTAGYCRQGFTLITGSTFRLQLTAKINTGQWFFLGLSDFTANSFGKSFDLTNGIVGTTNQGGSATYLSSSIVSLGSGWYTMTVSGSIASTAIYYFSMQPASANGTSGTTSGHDASIWNPVLIRTA